MRRPSRCSLTRRSSPGSPPVDLTRAGGRGGAADATSQPLALGTVGIFLLCSVYATQSGMAAVFGIQIDTCATQISLFVAMLFGAALLLQYPSGWLSAAWTAQARLRRVVPGRSGMRGGLTAGDRYGI